MIVINKTVILIGYKPISSITLWKVWTRSQEMCVGIVRNQRRNESFCCCTRSQYMKGTRSRSQLVKCSQGLRKISPTINLGFQTSESPEIVCILYTQTYTHTHVLCKCDVCIDIKRHTHSHIHIHTFRTHVQLSRLILGFVVLRKIGKGRDVNIQ